MSKPPLFFKLWVWMLLQATHTKHGGLRRGQLLTSLEQMRKAMGYKVGFRMEYPTKKEVRGVYEGLIEGTMIVSQKVTGGMIITILNYDTYQTMESYEGHGEGHDEIPFEGTIKTRMFLQEVKKTPSRKLSKEMDGRFDEFWMEYPRKVSKQAAANAWNKLSPSDALFGQIMMALKTVKKCEQWGKDNGKFVPHASTWLNNRRWEDEFEAVPEAPEAQETHQQTRKTLQYLDELRAAAGGAL